MKFTKFFALVATLALFSITTKAAPLVPPFIGTNEVALRSALLSLSNTVNGFTADTNGISATTASNITRAILILSNYNALIIAQGAASSNHSDALFSGAQPTNGGVSGAALAVMEKSARVIASESSFRIFIVQTPNRTIQPVSPVPVALK